MTHPIAPDGIVHQEENPFIDLRIDNNDILSTFKDRYPCGKCSKSRKFFCYTCFIPHPELKGVIPQIKLPLKIDIIKHNREIDGKSTAAHAAILAPDDVKVYTYPDIPSYDDEEVVLIFPSHSAVTIPQLFNKELLANLKEQIGNFTAEENDEEEYPKGYNRGTLMKNLVKIKTEEYQQPKIHGCMPVMKAVFIDSTWNQSRGIYKDERIKKLPCVVLQNRTSQFWRHQKGSPRWYLATIEAIHQFVLEMHLNAYGVHADYKGLQCCFTENNLVKYSSFLSNNKHAYCGQYDNLLYFFEYMYKLIHTYYTHEQLYAYKRRMS